MDKMMVKSKLLDFTIKSVERFLQENSSLEFYAFAYDCNAEYAEVNLSFNIESAFQETLHAYQNGKYAVNYQSEEGIKRLKYHSWDWKYVCFDTIYVLTDDELRSTFNNLPEDDYDSLFEDFIEDLNQLFCETLLDFTQSTVFNKIPKTKDFMVLCTDHDEDLMTAMNRLEKVRLR